MVGTELIINIISCPSRLYGEKEDMKMIIFYVWNESGYYFEVGNATYPTLKCTGLKCCYKSGFAIDTRHIP